jgi:site-specific DNA-methyltransferase (adenine-specific)
MSEFTLHCGDCVEYMVTMPDNSVDLIATDPPYHRVKMDEAWDRQHKTAGDFLAWLDTALVQFARILKPNGSLYLFASPRMAARVEVLISERLNVLNHITWDKSSEPTHALKYGDDRFRQYIQKSERIIFAEHYGADNIAKGEAGYVAKCDELRGFVFEPLRAYLDEERKRAGVSKSQANKLFDGPNVGQYWWQQRNWQLPIREHYETLREGLSRLNHGGQYLQRPYEELRTEYEELRTEYEELRTEYEELRRPFAVSADVPYTDVWTFPTVQAYAGKHSCEKPLSLMEHIVKASSKPGATVFDPFMGSGTTGVAAVKLGRHFIGCDLSERWVNRTRQRIETQAQTVQPSLLEVA